MLLSPIQGTLPRVTQKFGVDFKKNGKWVYKGMGMKGHNGIDFGVKVGTRVWASHDGEVTAVKYSKVGYGNHIKVRSPHLAKETIYAHLSNISVKVGDTIAIGQLLGLTGNTGFSTGPHLHWGFRRLIPGKGHISTWSVRDYKNGYFGWVDPLEWTLTWEGTLKVKFLNN
jgi:murein DD-endopeptidase MepM/ murein hydrolase activator NlpD